MISKGRLSAIFVLTLLVLVGAGGQAEKPATVEDYKNSGPDVELKPNSETESHNVSVTNDNELNDCTLQIEQLGKNLCELKATLEEVERNDADFTAQIEELRKKLKECEKTLYHMSNELNEGMVGRMDWQLNWFLILLTIVLVIPPAGTLLGYIYLRKSVHNRVTPPLDEFKHEADTTLDAASKVALANFQVCYATIDALKELPEAHKAKVLQGIEIAMARLRVSSDDSSEVIVGANILSQLGSYAEDGPLLRDALEREGLSMEARETLKRAIRDLKSKHD